MKRCFFVVLCCLLSLIANANTSISWMNCVEMAQKNNADFRAALESVRATKNQVGVSQSGFLPQVSANFGYTRSKNNTTNSEDDFSASLVGSQNLFNGLQDLGKIKQANSNLDSVSENLQIIKARITFDLKSAYEGLSYANEYQRLTIEIIRRRQENLRLVDIRFQSGRENKGSVYLSQAYLNQARYDDLQAQNAKRVSKAQLARAIGVDDFSDYEIQGEIPIQDQQPEQPNFRKLALETPEYRQIVAQESSADAAIIIARSQFFPTLNVTGNTGKQTHVFFSDPKNYWTVGVNLSLPVFSGGKDFYTTKSAAASWQSMDFQRINLARQLVSKLEQVYASYIEAIAKFKMDESFKQASEVRAEIARKRYNNGLMTFEDWDIIENDLISRQKNYLQSKRDRVIAEAAWEQAQGKGVIP